MNLVKLLKECIRENGTDGLASEINEALKQIAEEDGMGFESYEDTLQRAMSDCLNN